MDNPTRLLLEKTVSELECSGLPPQKESTCLAFSSGMQAVTSVILAHSTKGATTTVLIPTDVYHGVRSLLSGVFLRHGVEVIELDMVGDNGAETVANTMKEIVSNASNESDDNHCNIIVWMETPSNPKCQVVDIQDVCGAVNLVQEEWKESMDVTTVVDGTMASPVLSRPLEVRACHCVQETPEDLRLNFALLFANTVHIHFANLIKLFSNRHFRSKHTKSSELIYPSIREQNTWEDIPMP